MGCKSATQWVVVVVLVAFVVVSELPNGGHWARAQSSGDEEESATERTIQASSKVGGLLELLKRASGRTVGLASDVLLSIPFGKIALTGGALLGVFFLFVRLLIVLGPILILGALTRESTEPTDLIRMLIEFYNQVIVALDEQQMGANGAELQASSK